MILLIFLQSVSYTLSENMEITMFLPLGEARLSCVCAVNIVFQYNRELSSWYQDY
jgi:hypothetical protein